jgi:hypothetical protein
MTTNLIIGAVVIVLLGVFGFLVWNAARPAAGESVQIMANAGDHVPAGSDPGPFNSDPPTSGRHYAQEYDAGFYEPDDLETQADYPEGYLIHNLEHGYIIFWYNCDLLDEQSCDDLKGEIQAVMDDFNGVKVIGFPRNSIDVPVVMTSWGQLQAFSEFDPGQARAFVRANRNRAPEPNAP